MVTFIYEIVESCRFNYFINKNVIIFHLNCIYQYENKSFQCFAILKYI